MNLLKPLFFAKYKNDKPYDLPSQWLDCSMQRSDGQLSIWALPKNHAKGVIVLSHPMHKLGKHFFIEYGHTALYHQLGYHVVVFDYNGFGQSTDEGFDFTQDLLDAIAVAQQQFPDQSIGLHGVSFGAAQLILAAIGREEWFTGLLIESATSSNIEYYKGRGSKLFHILNAYNILFPKSNEHNIFYEKIKELKHIPLLFIYGHLDVKTPMWMGEKLYHAATTKKDFVKFDTSHLETIHEEPARYREVVQSFWEDKFG